MTITQAHRDQLVQMLRDQWTAQQLRHRHAQYQESGWTTRRYLFDLFYMIPTGPRQRWIDEVYKYANDEHLGTALKWAVKQIVD